MKKIILILLSVTISIGLFANPADNFKAAGISFGGSGSIDYNSEDFLNKEEVEKSTSLSLSLNPYFEFMLIDNLSLSVSPNIGYNSNMEHAYDSDLDTYDKEESSSMDIGVYLGGTYYLANEISDINTIIPFFSAGLGVYYYKNFDGKVNNVKEENKYTSISYYMGIDVGALYFLTESMAFRTYIDCQFNGSGTVTYSNGTKKVYADDYSFTEWLDMNVRLYAGLSWYIPNKNKLIVSEL